MWGRAKRIATWAIVLLFCAYFAMIAVSIVVIDLIPWSATDQLRSSKATYVGQWSGPRWIRISGNGDVRFQAGLTSYGGKIVRFSGDDFTVFRALVGPEQFHVSAPPHQEDNTTWVMTIDGDRYERTGF